MRHAHSDTVVKKWRKHDYDLRTLRHGDNRSQLKFNTFSYRDIICSGLSTFDVPKICGNELVHLKLEWTATFVWSAPYIT